MKRRQRLTQLKVAFINAKAAKQFIDFRNMAMFDYLYSKWEQFVEILFQRINDEKRSVPEYMAYILIIIATESVFLSQYIASEYNFEYQYHDTSPYTIIGYIVALNILATSILTYIVLRGIKISLKDRINTIALILYFVFLVAQTKYLIDTDHSFSLFPYMFFVLAISALFRKDGQNTTVDKRD